MKSHYSFIQKQLGFLDEFVMTAGGKHKKTVFMNSFTWQVIVYFENRCVGDFIFQEYIYIIYMLFYVSLFSHIGVNYVHFWMALSHQAKMLMFKGGHVLLHIFTKHPINIVVEDLCQKSKPILVI